MKFRKMFSYTLLVIFVCIGAGCESADKLLTASTTPIIETTMVSFTPTLLPPTKTSPPPPTWTPLPTLSFDEAHAHYLGLLETNAGCLLPCWWGITPGQTKWQDARQYLETFSMVVNDVDPSKETSWVTVHLPVLKDQGTLANDYYVRNGVVHWITSFNYDWATSFYLSNLLKTYGSPDKVYFRVFYPGFQEEKFSFLIDLYYEEGILVEYSGGDKTAPINGIHKNCYVDIYSPFIYLWSPNENLTPSEAIDTFLDNRNFPYPIPLEHATGKDITTFYDEFSNPNKVKCLETSQELWQ